MSVDNPRILLITDKFAPHTGGTAVIYGQWFDRLPPAAVEVVTCWFKGWKQHDAARSYPVRRVPYWNIPKLRMPLVWGCLWERAHRAVRARRPEVIHAGQILETGLTALQLRRKYGIPYVIHTYGEEINFYARYPRTRAWMKTVLRHAAAVTSISRFTVERMADLGLWDGPVSLQYPGADISRFTGAGSEEIRRRHGLGDGPVLLTVARLLPRKGHDRVLEALIPLRAAFPGLRYLIVGTGMEEARLRARAARLGLQDAVVFAGAVPHPEVPAYFGAADLFVHPNRQLEGGDVEGFGIVFLEAGASGLPVIGGNSGGTPDAIRHGETGYLVEPNDVDEIAGRIAELLGSPDLRRRMGQAGRDWAARFTWEAAAERVWALSRGVADEACREGHGAAEHRAK